MTSFFVKMITLPLILIIAMYMFEQIDYGGIWQPIVLSIILTIVGVAMEYFILKRGTLGVSVILDFIVTLLFLWILSNMFNNAEVTFIGALGLSLVIGFSELILHRYLIGTGQTSKPITNK